MGVDLDLGSLNDGLRRSVAAENVARSADADYRAAFPDVVTGAAAGNGGATRNLLGSAGPVSDAYLLGAAPRMLITGPGGSAKTTTSVKKAAIEAQRIWPGGDGIRRYTLGVWRQKYDNLWKTTIPSWWSVFPKDLPGSNWTGAVPRAARHHIVFEDAHGRIELTALFLAFGEAADPEDIKGFQFTDVWLNELPTMPEDLYSMLTDRVGREPPREMIRRGGRYFCDSNAPDVTSYVYRDWYEQPKPGHVLFRQPGGRDEGAENLAAMGRDYYHENALLNAHRPWWVRVMIDNRPGFLRHADPVYSKYDDMRNLSPTPIPVIRMLVVVVGIDGGLTPASAFCQEAPNGQGRTLAEIQLERGGMRELADHILALCATPRFEGCTFRFVCDPSMEAGEEKDDRGNPVAREGSRVAEGSDRQRLSEYLAAPVHIARSQEVTRRIEAVACKFDLAIDGGGPGYLLDPSCKGLRRGKNQTFHHRKTHGSDDRGPIAKTYDSHVSEAEQYAYLEFGTAEVRARVADRARARRERQEQAQNAKRYNPHRRRA